MTPQERKEFELVKRQLAELKDLFYKGDLPNKKVFNKAVELPFKTLANGIRLYSRANGAGVDILTGDAINDAGIKAEVGYTSPTGSIYMSTSVTQPFFIMVNTTWTLLNIP